MKKTRLTKPLEVTKFNMKFITTTVFKYLDGNDIEGATAGKVIANVLVMDREAVDPIRNHVLGVKLVSADEVELDKAEVAFIKECLKKDKSVFPLVKGPLLISLEEKPTE